MRSRALGLALLAAAPLALPAAAFHGETCSAEGAAPMLTTPAAPFTPPYLSGLQPKLAFAGVLGPVAGVPQAGLRHKWTLHVESGEHYTAVISTGDLQLSVCVAGATANHHACYAEGPVATFCMGLAPGFPSGIPLIGPGDFVVYVTNCTTVACGYPADAPAVAYAGVVD